MTPHEFAQSYKLAANESLGLARTGSVDENLALNVGPITF